MAAKTPRIWSEPLLALTRSVMNLDFVPLAELIYLKNINGEFGAIEVGDWLASKLCVRNRETLVESEFALVDALIAAGWAVEYAHGSVNFDGNGCDANVDCFRLRSNAVKSSDYPLIRNCIKVVLGNRRALGVFRFKNRFAKCAREFRYRARPEMETTGHDQSRLPRKCAAY